MFKTDINWQKQNCCKIFFLVCILLNCISAFIWFFTSEEKETNIYPIPHSLRGDRPHPHFLEGHHSIQRFLEGHQPVHHIAFLKVHKAGSTTIQNIFLRYGWNNDLVFILPKILPTISMNNSIVRGVNILPPPPNRSYDISCCHVLYNRQAFEKVLPKDTIYIGLLRDPFDQFISNINYGKKGYMLKIGQVNPILKFLQQPDYYLRNDSLTMHQPIPAIYNRMAYDFGFPMNLFKNYDDKLVAEYLRKLDKELDFVIIMEYMDECLVMIRRLLNWEVKDVVYAALNKGKKDNPILDTGVEERRLYHQWSKLDVVLYEFFLRKFLRLWAELSLHSDVQDELIFFREVRIQVTEFCKRPSDFKGMLSFGKSNWSFPFQVTNENCSLIELPEINFLQKVEKRQSSAR